MLDMSPELQAKLDARATTFCHCWRLARADGAVMGFTDHDRPLTFNGIVFRANAGLSSSQVETTLGFAVGGGEAAGALSDDGITEGDLLNGLYDGASVETWLVDWTHVEDRVLLDVATVGEVRRGEHAFSAELRGAAHLFDQPQGRNFQRGCSADFGDARCGANVAAYRVAGTVADSSESLLSITTPAVFDSGFFSGGRLSFTSGANAGAEFAVSSHRRDNGLLATIELWTPPGGATARGDGVFLTAGCDKSATTCRMKFANIANFRGFPHMPGNDRVIAYPNARTEAMDGGSFFR